MRGPSACNYRGMVNEFTPNRVSSNRLTALIVMKGKGGKFSRREDHDFDTLQNCGALTKSRGPGEFSLLTPPPSQWACPQPSISCFTVKGLVSRLLLGLMLFQSLYKLFYY